MLIFDQLKKGDPHLRLLTLVVLGGLAILFTGLWWVQIVSAKDYRANLETQSFRTVRVPAVRGKIFDRNGTALADNLPSYNVNLYLEELRKTFQQAYSEEVLRVRTILNAAMLEREKKLNRKLTRQEKKQFILTPGQRTQLGRQTRYEVVHKLLTQLGQNMQRPLILDETNFHRHYEKSLAMPLPVLANLDTAQIARFEEQMPTPAVLDLEVQPFRFYPYNTAAAHLLGHLQKDDSSVEGEEAFFNYRLPDYRGQVGIEAAFDPQLRGKAGAKSVLVNNLGYRQTENIWSAVEPGQNVTLTIDLPVQQAAERALARLGASTRGAVVVMDTQSGDVLAMVSSPSYDPNIYIKGFPPGEGQRLSDPVLRPQINRATQMQYQPASTFKTIVALALLETPEAHFNPSEKYHVAPNPANPARGIIHVGNQPFKDTVPPGDYDLRLALVRSSNAYFITNGLRHGVFEHVMELGQRLHLGEKIGLNLNQEARGHFPELEHVRNWPAGEKANICIGQGQMDVTPLQMAVLTSALANGGDVLQPRLVDRLESQDPAALEPPTVFPKHQVRDVLGVSRRSLDIVRDDMLAETEDVAEGGTGRTARVAGLRICGKTGTAERKEKGQTRNTTWFISYAPYEHPKYAVVVAVEDGASGGTTCAPIARDIYLAIQQREKTGGIKTETLAQTN